MFSNYVFSKEALWDKVIVYRVRLALHAADLSFILGIPYGPLRPQGAILVTPELLWKCPSVPKEYANLSFK